MGLKELTRPEIRAELEKLYAIDVPSDLSMLISAFINCGATLPEAIDVVSVILVRLCLYPKKTLKLVQTVRARFQGES
jgi:hypothetical protein